MANPKNETRQIVGFSLNPKLAKEVKDEAARKGIRLNTLFEEIWSTYKAQSK